MTEGLRDSARRALEGFAGDLLWDEPLSRHTYYRIGGAADLVAVPRSKSDLALLAGLLGSSPAPLFILGAGSNLLVSDQGFRGVVVRTHRMNLVISAAEGGVVRAGASVMVFSLLKRAGEEGWGGLEFMTGIPGTLGGVVFMNGGTHLGEACDRLESVEAFSLRTGGWRSIPKSEFRFSYRHNAFLGEDEAIWETSWRFDPEDPALVKARVDEALARRKSSQPVDKPSCGSVFKNPRESSLRAWEVLEKLGLRGQRNGNAQFSEKHPNFIVNLGGARAEDVRSLIELARSRAKDELGITLEEEVRYLGF
ncbi:MAG: UDP-N-acetylmuramate dehydrogenase [Bdellovibrionales bacterium]|nr:UDP-N-acetylmuramate dehydrogenase [Bdellovibrionales bacterium]